MAWIVSRYTCLIAVLGCFACAVPKSDPWIVEANRATGDGDIRILLLHDMEGLSGQTNPLTFRYGTKEYAQGQERLIADVNAVVAGLFDGGADVVDIADAHGSGNPQPDLLLDRLDPRARHIMLDHPFNPYTEFARPGAYDGVAVVGMHAKSGSGGFAAHTWSIGIRIHVGDRSLTEAELVALSFGDVGIPLIFASGDDRLARDIAHLDWVEYVTTKHSNNAWSARALPLDGVERDLRQSAAEAVRNRLQAKVIKLDWPVDAKIEAVSPSDLSFLNVLQGVGYQDGGISFDAENPDDFFDHTTKIIGLANIGLNRHAVQATQQLSPLEQAMVNQGFRVSDVLWLNAESGILRKAAPTTRQQNYGGAQ
ncbi:M55 family metallopeptidase [Pacificimonas sp. WHA3]|uniref:M55 family metallopeptidase n=1 Tax=Pacificimonas pallii TaxID=2827236 RepID=A0ABS6SAR4_9SPHN|nr:M55 family metallopeptidase [Pacificimonas pallii]MBV7255300.1 M55 family metallopeptidase [Pacificimonas pallii]